MIHTHINSYVHKQIGLEVLILNDAEYAYSFLTG